jgi:hypothetical protein
VSALELNYVTSVELLLMIVALFSQVVQIVTAFIDVVYCNRADKFIFY